MTIQRRSSKEFEETGRTFVLGGKLDTLIDNFTESANGSAAVEVEAFGALLDYAKWDVDLAVLPIILRDDYPNLVGEWEGEKVMKLIQEKIDALPEPNLTDSEKAKRILEYGERSHTGLSFQKNIEGKSEYEILKQEMKALDLM